MTMSRHSVSDSTPSVVRLAECFDVGKTIGTGRYGVVKECTNKKSGQKFAGKFVKRRRSRKNAGQADEVQNEVDILRSVQHPSIIRLFEVFETPLEVVLILELVSGGELFDYLTQHSVVKEEEVVWYLIQLLKALHYLHSIPIIHMDLKPENIVLKDTASKEIKLIDFGLSRKLTKNVELRELAGTPEFVAPEVVNFDPLTCAVDMWSVGVITYVMISGVSPFHGSTPQETLSNVTMATFDFEEFAEEASGLSKDFISKLLRVKAKRRMTAAEALQHPWIEPRNELEVESRRRSKINVEKLASFMARKKWKQSFHAVSIYNHLLHKAIQKAQLRHMAQSIQNSTDINDHNSAASSANGSDTEALMVPDHVDESKNAKHLNFADIVVDLNEGHSTCEGISGVTQATENLRVALSLNPLSPSFVTSDSLFLSHNMAPLTFPEESSHQF